MRKRSKEKITNCWRALLLITCGLIAAGATYSQSGSSSGGSSGSCAVNRLHLRFATGDDDLRGGHDNLNIVVYFAGGGYQLAANVNQSRNWPNNSVNLVEIPLNRPIPVNEIQSFRLVHIADGGFNIASLPELATPAAPIAIAQAFQSPDNWNMAEVTVAALGNGVSFRIAGHGFHRFTGSNPDLVFNTKVPANACGSGSPTGSSGGGGPNRGLNPSGSGLRSVTGGGSGTPGSSGLEPLIPRDGSNSSSGGASGTGALHKLNPPAQMVLRPLTAKMKATLGPPKKGQPIQNTRALQANSAIALVLQQQRQGADAEASHMANVAVHSPAPQSAMLGQQSQLMSANGANAGTPTVQPQATPAIANSTKPSAAAQPQANRTMLMAPPTVRTTPPQGVAGNIGPSQTLNASGNATGSSPALRQGAILTQPSNATGTTGNSSSSSKFSSAARIGYLPSANATVLICAQNPAMRILNVSGSSSPATFTPVGQYNFYTITGCSFGNVGPNAKVYIYKGATFHEEFQIQEWNDNWIKLNLDPNLSGLLDQDSLTLVVQRADGQQATQTGFKFYAARERRLLNQIPSSDFSLYGLNTVDTSKWSQSYASPVGPADSYRFGGMTAGVAISEGLPYIQGNFDTQDMPSAGTDIYDLSHLQPGFTPTEADISWYDMGCSNYGGTVVTSGSWGGEFNGSQLWINFPGENCKNVSNCNLWGCTDYFINPLIYGLDVWVEGPRGVDPWTGQPTTHP